MMSVFGFDPKKKKDNESMLDAFLFQFERPVLIIHISEEIHRDVKDELVENYHEIKKDPIVEEANRVQEEMFQKQSWYILETLTQGTMDYLQVKNLKTSGTKLTPETLKHYIDVLNPGYTEEQIDNLVASAAELENVPNPESNVKESTLEKVLEYNKNEEYIHDRELMEKGKTNQILSSFNIDQEEFKNRFSPLIKNGEPTPEFKNEYKKYISERISQLPEHEKTENNFFKECQKVNFAIKNVLAKDDTLNIDKPSKLYNGAMDKEDFSKECNKNVSIRATSNSMIDKYQNLNTKLQNKQIKQKDYAKELGKIIKTGEEQHAKRSFGTRFADWFRRRGFDSIKKAIIADALKHTNYSKDELQGFIDNAKGSTNIENYADKHLNSNSIDFKDCGLNDDINKLDDLNIDDLRKQEQEEIKRQEEEAKRQQEELEKQEALKKEQEEKEAEENIINEEELKNQLADKVDKNGNALNENNQKVEEFQVNLMVDLNSEFEIIDNYMDNFDSHIEENNSVLSNDEEQDLSKDENGLSIN